METTNPTAEYVIDATGKRLGKIATEAASVLNGKNSAQFAKNVVAPVVVKIENASKMDINEKRQTEIFQTYSGYPSGQRSETLIHLATRLGYAEVLRRTIKGMLPKNKLQKLRLQNLIVTE
ncbi:MAG: uL13 family ribosomal protein [Candidatus Paceibacterota bacterium]